MSEPLLVADGLARRFRVSARTFAAPARWLHAVCGVDLAVQRGKTLALVGESGCGKSTAGRLALGLLRPDAGRVTFAGEELTALRPGALRRLRRRMQIVFQDPISALNARRTAGAAIEEPLEIHEPGLSRGDRRDRVAALLERVGIDPAAAARYPAEFSGGQRQRIVIARALACGPELVFADEPVSALDVSVQAQILNLLLELQRERGIAYLFVSHDMRTVRHVADDVAVMYLGRIVESGPAPAVLGGPRHPYTRALLAAATRAPVASRPPPLTGEPPSPLSPPPGCPFEPRCALARSFGSEPRRLCREELPPLVSAPGGAPGQLARCHHADRG
jgi:oligopeptide/dipeptide ABC transporter ATP-binding protein